MGTLYCALKHGVYLYERQKIRHYSARSVEEKRTRCRRKKKKKTKKKNKIIIIIRRRRMSNRDIFYFARCLCKIALYSDVIYSFDWKSAVEHLLCFKCMIVYLARDIPACVMYCVNGASRSSLLIESTTL